MAQRFGGKFSLDGGEPQAPRAGGVKSGAGGAGLRANILFFAPLPLVVRAFWQQPAGMVLMLAGFGLLVLAAWLTREGLIAEAAYNARKIARRPAIPRKLFGAAGLGAGLFTAALASGGGLVGPVLYGALGAALHLFSFGFDPMRDKGAEGIDAFQQDRVARVVDEGEKHLKAMSDAIARAGDRKLETRVAQFQATAREMFRTVEEDPGDLTAARKYLGVYLMGARDATVKFADLYARTRDAKALGDYKVLLDDLEQNFAARTRALLLDDRADLDVEIEVLRERLQRDGVRS